MTIRAPADELFQKAIEMDKAGRSAEAARLYHEILKTDPAHPYAHYLLGVQALHQANYDEAIRLIQKAIAHQPHETTFHYFLGQAYQARGDLEQALKIFRNVFQ